MKKLYQQLKKHIATHSKIFIAILLTFCIISGISLVYSKLTILVIINFSASLFSMDNVITYRYGRIPIFSIDRIWSSYKWKYRKTHSEEEIEKIYKNSALKKACVSIIICCISFPVWIFFEILLY